MVTSSRLHELWKDPEYRIKVSVGVSKAQKEVWKNKSIQGHKRIFYEELKQAIINRGWTPLTSLDEYVQIGAKFKCLCENNHLQEVTYKYFVSNTNQRTCKQCNLEFRENLVFDYLKKKKFTLKSMTRTPRGLPQYITYVCSHGHENTTLAGNLLQSDCPYCLVKESAPQREVKEFLQENGIIDLEIDRKIIPPFDLDIYCPSKKIAIEFNGYPFHAEKVGGKTKEYHLKKTLMCEKLDIQLIHLMWYEWEYKKEVCKKIFLDLFEISKEFKISDIKDLSEKRYFTFCKKNCLEYKAADIRIGAFHSKKLISCISFNIKNSEEAEFVLFAGATFAFNLLLKYFIQTYNISKITALTDRRWNQGKLFKDFGFTLLNASEPNCWMVAPKTKEVKSFNDMYTSNWTILSEQGYDRFWDCGSNFWHLNLSS